jgi:hypothetical protein
MYLIEVGLYMAWNLLRRSDILVDMQLFPLMMRYIYPRDASDVYIGKLVAVVSGYNNKYSSCPVNDSCSAQP